MTVEERRIEELEQRVVKLEKWVQEFTMKEAKEKLKRIKKKDR